MEPAVVLSPTRTVSSSLVRDATENRNAIPRILLLLFSQRASFRVVVAFDHLFLELFRPMLGRTGIRI